MKHALFAVNLGLGSHFFSGCSTYPLPQDYSGYTTHQIVTNIRCEARDAVQDAVIFAFDRYNGKPVFRNRQGQLMTGDMAASYFRDDKRRFSDFNIDKQVVGDARDAFRYYKTTQIAYDFSLKGMESNTQGFDLGLVRPFGLRKDTLGIASSATRGREVTRGFFLWDTFDGLLKAPDRFCEAGKLVNIFYPITGKLQIYDLIQSYIYENDQGALIIKNPNELRVPDKKPLIPQMADTINFTTRLNGNMSPKFAYNPAGIGLQVASLDLTNTNYREDTHKVVVAISTAESNVPPRFRPYGRVPQTITPQDRLNAARDSIVTQNDRRVRDAIIDIGDGFSRIPF